MDFNALQHKLFAMDPVDPREDLARLRAQAGGNAPAPAAQVDYITESASVPEGSLQMDKNYSISDFAALAGVSVTEKKQRDADQVRGSDPMPAAEPGRTKHPHQDRLVGESSADAMVGTLMAKVQELEARIARLENPVAERELTRGEEKEKERIVKGMKKNRSDFKDRYGDDAEAVMYATATKRAKNESVDSIKDQLYAALNKKMGL